METNLSKESKIYLLETSKWAKFLAIVSFVFIGFILIMALIMVTAFGALESTLAAQESSAFEPFTFMSAGIYTLMVILYLIIAILYFFPSLYLYRFAVKMKQGLLNDEHFNIDQGLMNLKSVFKFWGIYTAVCLGLYAVMFVFGILLQAFI